jgi:uncharacterized membrane protein
MNVQQGSDHRVETLERELRALERRFDRLEGRLGLATSGTAAPLATSPVVHKPTRPASAAASAPVRPEYSKAARGLVARTWTPPSIEDLLGRRLLALVGGAAFLLGVAFLVALAVERGWIDETARVVLAFLAASCVLGVGVWLHERHGRLQATLAMVGAGLAGLYLTLTAASVLYALIPAPAALVAALAIGALAAGLAIRWDSRTVAGLGIVGTLLAPVLADSLTTAGIGFLAVASVSACAVTIWRRWDWLTIVAFVVAMPQVAVWTLGSPSPSSPVLVLVLAGFAALNLAASLGFELRVPTTGLRGPSSVLALFSALIPASLGYAGLPHGEGELAGGLWIAALALAHAALGVGALRIRRVSNEIALLFLGIALTLGNLAFGLLADGVVLAVGWAASAALLAWAARRLGRRGELVSLTLGGQLALAIGHTLLFDAPPSAIAGGSGETASAVSALAAILVAAFAAARLTTKEAAARRMVLDALSMATLACLSALALDGVPLVLAWAFEAAALAEVAGRRRDRTAATGALGFFVLAALHVLALEAPPDALLFGVDSLVAAAIGLGALAATLLQFLRSGVLSEPGERRTLAALVPAALLYLCSVAIVTPFQPGPDALDTGLTLGIRQQGQLLLSVFWGACGFAALWAGLRRNTRPLRLAGFALLSLTVGKVFLYDLATLASIYRVASLVALGLLLLTAAFSYQRLRAGQ